MKAIFNKKNIFNVLRVLAKITNTFFLLSLVYFVMDKTKSSEHVVVISSQAWFVLNAIMYLMYEKQINQMVNNK